MKVGVLSKIGMALVVCGISLGACVVAEKDSGTRDECSTDSDCASGDICWAGACATPSSTECVEDADCASTDFCDTDTGYCMTYVVVDDGCLSSSDCPTGETCDSSGACVVASEGPCASELDCDTDQICGSDGSCIPAGTCVSELDCDTDQICDSDGTCAPASSGMTCDECACQLLISEGGCANICDGDLNGTGGTPNYCNGANTLTSCASCLATTCADVCP